MEVPDHGRVVLEGLIGLVGRLLEVFGQSGHLRIQISNHDLEVDVGFLELGIFVEGFLTLIGLCFESLLKLFNLDLDLFQFRLDLAH